VSALTRQSGLLLVGALVAGLAVGALTSFGQGHLSPTLEPLVNSAAAWLVAPFLVGMLAGRPRAAALAGFLCCISQLLGYDLTSHLRGFATDDATDAFWGLCALAGGPVFGAGGYYARSSDGAVRGLGPSLLAAAFVVEGLWTYWHLLGRTGAAALWIGVGIAIAVTGLRGWRGYRWLLGTIPLAFVGELVLATIKS
jgi:hypothetical protein